VKRFVFISSITVAGIPSEVPATEETAPASPLQDQYTRYKGKAEEILRSGPDGFEWAVVRPGIVYGPRSRHLARMLRTVVKLGPIGIPFIGSGRNRAPFIQVQDLAEAVFLAGTRPEAAGQVFNISDGTGHSWLEFFTALGRAQGKEVRLIPLPPFLLRVPAVFADLFAGFAGLRLDLHSYVTFMSRDVDFDTGKARSLLGWEPRHGDLQKAVEEMVKWYAEKKGE
jgi:nucleoside-diphosphate-sugar epimerase